MPEIEIDGKRFFVPSELTVCPGHLKIVAELAKEVMLDLFKGDNFSEVSKQCGKGHLVWVQAQKDGSIIVSCSKGENPRLKMLA